jgi:hypothetical protein
LAFCSNGRALRNLTQYDRIIGGREQMTNVSRTEVESVLLARTPGDRARSTDATYDQASELMNRATITPVISVI